MKQVFPKFLSPTSPLIFPSPSPSLDPPPGAFNARTPAAPEPPPVRRFFGLLRLYRGAPGDEKRDERRGLAISNTVFLRGSLPLSALAALTFPRTPSLVKPRKRWFSRAAQGLSRLRRPPLPDLTAAPSASAARSSLSSPLPFPPPTPLCHCLRHNVLIPAVLAQPQLPPLHHAHLLTLLHLLFLPSSPSPPPPLRVPAKVGVGQGRGLGHITMPATAGWTVTGRVSSRVLQTRVTPTHGGRRT